MINHLQIFLLFYIFNESVKFFFDSIDFFITFDE